MTPQRQAWVRLAQKHLGPVFPIWGIVSSPSGLYLVCECQNADCQHPGKHPRIRRKLKNTATPDPKKLEKWFKKYPNSNFAVYTGIACLVVDVDIRADKDGSASLRQLEADAGQTIPETVTVQSGRGVGHHLYFKMPEGLTLKSRNSFLPGLDAKAVNQYVIAPGSRHLSGGYYQFPEHLSPEQQDVADLPSWLLDAIQRVSASKKAIVRAASNRPLTPELLDNLPAPGKRYSKKRILGVVYRDGEAGPLLRGTLKPANRSEGDMRLAAKLAFYCCHHFDLALEIFRESARYRDKFDKLVDKHGRYTYAEWTLRKAFINNPGNWIPKHRGTGKPNGRTVSSQTRAILSVHAEQPDWTPAEIGRYLLISRQSVSRVLRDLKNGRYQAVMSSLILDPSPTLVEA